MYKIPFSKNKLQVWLFTFDYNETYLNIEKEINTLKSACQEIKTSDIIKKILSIILTIGNILNGGTPKGQADGFSLDILEKINSVKDNTNQKTLMHYICGLLKKEDENFENVKSKFPNLSEGSKISISENQSNINKLKKDLKENLKSLNEITIEDEFTKKSKKLYDNYSIQVEDVEKNVKYY